ncbi:hypothetical protein GCM10010156_77410 [Planobispora rosea]|uniref:Uncharacterized protein n=1 Tax=Planobispora rosea TaxID=35762 RepID=A0A8J3SCF4_PLARO|nr:hypothetical protein [Planobispora rosea]GGT09048.1 hypothetical protein GCM10010156_77410 [Planobispora rosea]GIH89259.1 hypothetical protein Pro02_76670 [Planobispora rosea]
MQAANTAPTPRRWIDVLKDRWPTAVAIGLTFLTLSGASDLNAEVRSLAQVFPALPLLYLAVANLGRPALSWPLLGVGMVIIVGARLLDLVAPSTILLALALVVLVWGMIDEHSRRSGEFRIQVIGMIGFGALALAGLALDPEIGRYAVGAGWLLHGVWDFVHLWRGRVVARSYAEWCGVLDVLIGLELIFLL